MNKRWLIVPICLGVFLLALSFYAGSADACAGRWACGDNMIKLSAPAQLCVNQQLLTIKPAKPSDVYIHVPGDAVVESDVTSCGGTLQAMSTDKVSNDSPKHIVKIGAVTSPDAPIEFTYGDQEVTRTSDDGLVSVKFDAK